MDPPEQNGHQELLLQGCFDEAPPQQWHAIVHTVFVHFNARGRVFPIVVLLWLVPAQEGKRDTMKKIASPPLSSFLGSYLHKSVSESTQMRNIATSVLLSFFGSYLHKCWREDTLTMFFLL